ncbi:hypothetical protein DCS_06955 [Drechmeria coniospora]|uniref:RING-10 protein n=1 Tax=Drechmeria coniospora TaxID=98403 RepID=A0A151GD64_DRECN|nr:hypothetical protein DCS_06955 [Drechmeria coniospora]KYK54994.1 hypothetical protein DCS_06955 [Drechmeria coniospora]ODA82375.1 hypothetical protein RJ55_00882 [Drechmeria coniospora]
MHSYYYHLKFELYPTPNPTARPSSEARDEGEIWLPPPDADAFDDFPSSPRKRHSSARSNGDDRWELPHATAAPLAEESLPRNPNPAVIDCGSPRVPVPEGGRRAVVVRERQPPGHVETRQATARKSQAAIGDWRFGRVSIETVDLSRPYDMAKEASKASPSAAPSLGPSFGGAGTATKAECLPLETTSTELGWGVVHFYREEDETPSLGRRTDQPELDTEASGKEEASAPTDDEGTTLCIPAVPAYMSPGDFMGFAGERWMSDISHCRMVMTSQMNRYLVLLKFRDGERAKQWKLAFDGKVFNAMEPKVCHVVFVKSITFETPTQKRPSARSASLSSVVSGGLGLKPFPPPTPNLIELPTCPVCLERMDETNGLMTIPCSHVFHCACLQSWKGAGCPVCRFTNEASSQGPASEPDGGAGGHSQPFGSSASNLCSACDCADDLWICLLCGYVGCGRYKGAHAKEHWKETAHSFALELETQHVWDYAGDMWVHRLIRDKGDGKVVELPGRNRRTREGESEDVVPRAKLENIGLEYTHLITSQLESQRAYYEEMISKAVDKAAKAAAVAESSSSRSSKVMERLGELEDEHERLRTETVPQLERDLERQGAKAAKAEALARSLGNALQEEKRLNEGLMKRIEHLGVDNEAARRGLEELKRENADLKEMNRDLSMFISGQEKLRELEREGTLDEGEIAGGSASVPEKKGRRRGKK